MRVVDLFSGCGGLSLGFMNAGFDVVAAFEYWDKAIDVYRTNIPSHPVLKKDLSDVESSVKEIAAFSPEMIIGGPPCQDYSSAGKRVEGSRANLTRCFALIVSAIRPKMFVMENVARAQKSKAFADAREVFKDAGYGLTEIILNADLCGVPQDRKRFFCVGILGADDGTLTDIMESNLSSRPMTMRDYFGSSLGFEYYYRHPRSYARRAIFSIDEPSPTIRGVNRPVPKGYNGNKNDACPMKPGIRPLTTLERSLIQTFPPEFKWPSNKTDTEQMIGNAVPVKLAEYVARSIQKFIDSGYVETIQDIEKFEYWLETDKLYNKKTAGSIVSRLKRANSIVSLLNNRDAYVGKLESKEVYSGLSPSDKSHLKKSVQLYYEYVDIHEDNARTMLCNP